MPLGPQPDLVRIDVWDLRRLFNEGRFIQRWRVGELSAASVWYSVVKPDNPRIGPTIPLGSISQRLELYNRDRSLAAEYQRFIKPDGTIGGSGFNDPKIVVLNNKEFHQPERGASMRRLSNVDINEILGKRGLRSLETYFFGWIGHAKKVWYVEVRPKLVRIGLCEPR